MSFIDRLLRREPTPQVTESSVLRVERKSPSHMTAFDDQLRISDDGQETAIYTRSIDGSWSCRFPTYDDPGTDTVLPPNSPENLHISFLYFSARKTQT